MTRETLVASARQELVERRRRRHHFPEGMFGEPAWEILLLLYVQKEERRFTVGRLAEALDFPQNSTGRWLKYLQSAGLARRRPHHLDQRAILAEITEEGVEAVETYFSGRPVSTR
jgi:DNA-binding MarR family transcriptional regulator